MSTDLPPLREAGSRWWNLEPRTASRALLWCLLVGYVFLWMAGNHGLLFDPLLQTDDARTSLFPFHQYEKGGALSDDPIAREMLGFVPPAVEHIYQLLVPYFGIFVAAKIVQVMALGLLAAAAIILIRAPGAGLAAGVLLVFLVLHTSFITARGIAGGLPRAFAFPALGLWVAGALTGRDWVRRASAAIGAAAYPPAMLLILGAEGLYLLQLTFRSQQRRWLRTLGGYLALAATCFVLLSPMLGRDDNLGPIQTLEQAYQEPAFYRDGRLHVLPFHSPLVEFPRHIVMPYIISGSWWLPDRFNFWHNGTAALLVAMIPLVLLWFAVLWRRAPIPVISLSLLLSATLLYILARLFAFHLYSPERYYSYGLVIAAIALPIEVLGQWRTRAVAPSMTSCDGAESRRNQLSAVFILALFTVGGTGIDPQRNGMTIDGRSEAGLYAFVRTLPLDIRVAAHPMDGDDIPLWAARATTGGYETLQPWFVKAWRRQRQRAEDTLRAFYSVTRSDVLEYCARYRVTHLLLNKARYGFDFKERAGLFEPFGSFVRGLVADVELSDLVLADVPPEAIMFEDQRFRLVSVERLRAAWDLQADSFPPDGRRPPEGVVEGMRGTKSRPQGAVFLSRQTSNRKRR